MVVKREYSESESELELGFEDEDEDVKPVITTPKKPKITPTKNSSPKSKSTKAKSEGEGSPSKHTKLDATAKRTIAEEIILVGIKGIDVESLARATGLSVQQIRSQVAGGGRANLRRQLMDLAKSL